MPLAGFIDLSRRSLGEVPERDWQGTETLSLFDNRLASLPPLGDCLQIINLRRNVFEVIPPTLYACTSLTNLVLAENRLKEIPEDVCKLRRLTLLDASANIITLVADLTALTKLTILNLKNNLLVERPALPKSLHFCDLDENPGLFSKEASGAASGTTSGSSEASFVGSCIIGSLGKEMSKERQ